MNSAIEVRNLTKQYPGFALKDVSFQIPEGSIVGFIGENGAGKSTTIKAILDLIKRDGGEITLFGEMDGAKDETLKEQIGVVFDENCFPDYLNRRDVNRMLKAIYRGWPVSYTHLDVYKRQPWDRPLTGAICWTIWI